MIAIVESGSTKADWLIVNSSKKNQYQTQGFNPFFHSYKDVYDHLQEHSYLKELRYKLKEIHFYGAGCSSDQLNKKIADGLSMFFPDASISVDHDLKASALSLHQGQPLVACILGTGSNSCFYDGQSLEEKVPALGFILGDEGSGCDFGKKLLRDFLYDDLPSELKTDFIQSGFTKSMIFDRVYASSGANVFIASTARFLIKHKSLDYSQNLIDNGINSFLDKHVFCYDMKRVANVGFVGSIAKLLEKELREICSSRGVSVGRIIQRPLESLAEYHLSSSSK